MSADSRDTWEARMRARGRRSVILRTLVFYAVFFSLAGAAFGIVASGIVKLVQKWFRIF
jgi:hypothetical protein